MSSATMTTNKQMRSRRRERGPTRMPRHQCLGINVSPPKPWRWEIYRAGRKSPIKQSDIFFESVAEANSAGKLALKRLLSDYPD